VQNLDQAVAGKQFGKLLLGIRVRKQVLDTSKSMLCRQFESIWKIDFIEQHGQIRSKLWHASLRKDEPLGKNNRFVHSRTHGRVSLDQDKQFACQPEKWCGLQASESNPGPM
jgi:hypothetical protein